MVSRDSFARVIDLVVDCFHSKILDLDSPRYNLIRLLKVKGLEWIRKESKKLFILLEIILIKYGPLLTLKGINKEKRKSLSPARYSVPHGR